MRIVFFTESLFPLVDGVSHTLAHLFPRSSAGVEFRSMRHSCRAPEISWSGRVRRVRSFAFPLYRDYRVSLPGGAGCARNSTSTRRTSSTW
jgi:transposase